MHLSEWKVFLNVEIISHCKRMLQQWYTCTKMFHLHIPSKALYLFCMYERPQNALSIKQLGFIGDLILLTNEQQKYMYMYMYMHVSSTEN